ncbi:MAG: tetratricopeptide repeat protein [Pseudomonadota bacterium]|nr:tetratricopeptide repeat protein [Pseudomonadota bacterium]
MSKTGRTGRQRRGTDDPEFELAVAAFNEGRLNDSARLCTAVVTRDPSYGPAHYFFGVAALRAGDYTQARDALERGLALMPHDSATQADLAATYLGFGLVGEAKRLLKKIPGKQRDNVNYFILLAQVCALADDRKEAHRAYRRANELLPGEVSILKPLSDLVAVFDGADAGVRLFKDAMGSVGRRPVLLTALGLFQISQSMLDEAIQTFQTVLADNPSDGSAIVGLFIAYQKACLWTRAKELENKLDELTSVAMAAGNSPEEHPLLYVGRSQDSASALKLTRLRSAPIERESSILPRPPALPRRDGRLTIGYISTDLKNHPVAHLCTGMFGAHDRKAHRVIAYSLGNDDDSAYRRNIAQSCDKFVDLRSVSSSFVAAQMIREDEVDILVDLNGWTTDARLHILAHRPAPIQVTNLGYPVTCGSGFHDFIIADRIICPEAEAPYYSEAFAYLPHSYQINDDRQAIDPDRPSRTHAGLPEDAFVLACFNRAEKIDEASFLSWMRMLERVPDSVLWLASTAGLTERTLRDAAQLHGISGERLIFAPRAPKPQHLARLGHVDLAVDTGIYNGHTTTSDALWAGVPVITVTGSHFASRVSTSLLEAVGLDELACSSLEEYENLAVDLAGDPERLGHFRQALSTPADTPLFRTADTVRSLEDLYGQMADRYDRSDPPAIISAPAG